MVYLSTDSVVPPRRYRLPMKYPLSDVTHSYIRDPISATDFQWYHHVNEGVSTLLSTLYNAYDRKKGTKRNLDSFLLVFRKTRSFFFGFIFSVSLTIYNDGTIRTELGSETTSA